LASASSDKTVSIWDTRMALCVQTFYGHQGAVTGCKFNVKGDRLASCDANGIIKTWDLKAGK
jgi:WD40 repeat protein